jgi:hypothetical protein
MFVATYCSSNCIPGMYLNQGSCSLCPMGTFSNTSGSTVCQDCPILGSYAKVGATSCTCFAGMFLDSTQGVCSLCPLGTFSNSTGRSSCDICPPSSYTNSSGSTACLKCSANAIAKKKGIYSSCPVTNLASCSAFDTYLNDSPFTFMYKYMNTTLSFDAAELACENLHPDSNLVIFRDSFVYSWARSVVAAKASSAGLWIGFSQTSTVAEPAGNWFWLDGSNVSSPLTWSSGQPDNSGGSENCALLFSGGGFDFPCSTQRGFFCEVNGKPTLIYFLCSTTFLFSYPLQF